ncbi:MAG: hypothetical protein Q9194_004205 [Teloschistes cf. exilis]
MASITTHQLGKHGPQVPCLGFGLMGLSSAYGAVESTEERLKVLDRAYELGETFWDSADVYADSEDLVGEWFKRSGKRNDIFLATKFALSMTNSGMKTRSDPEYVKESCDKSLKRLGVDCIDLYYCHRVDGKTPIEKTVEAMAELKKEGKVKYIGLSEVSSATLRRAHAVHPITAVQIEYSPFAMDIEDPQIALLKTCRELGVATIAYSPLGRGFLTGAIKSPADFEEGDFRTYSPRFSEQNFPKNLELVTHFQEIAKKKGCTAGQLSLAWLLAQGKDIFPIPGTKKIKYLEENLGALDVKLSNAEIKEIREAIEKVEVHGERYPPGLISWLASHETPREMGPRILINSGAHVLLVRHHKDDRAAHATYDYRDLTQYLLFATGQLQPDEEHFPIFTSLAKKAQAGHTIPLRDAKSLGNKEPFMTLPLTANLTHAIEVFGGGVHRIVIVEEGTDNVVGILSQLRLVKFLWENGRSFPILDQLYSQSIKDLGIGSQQTISVNGDKALKEALLLMNHEGLTSLAVVDNQLNVVGNISNVDTKLLTKSSSAPLLDNTCIHFISVILSTRGVNDGKDSFPVFHINPYSTLAHTVAKLVATKAHRTVLF